MRSLSRNKARSSAGARHGLEIIGAVEPGGAVEIGGAHGAGMLEIFARRVFRAVEHDVLEQVREAGAAGRLVLRTDIVPDADRDDRRLAVLMDDHPKPVRQGEGLMRDVHPGEQLPDRVVAGGRRAGAGQRRRPSKRPRASATEAKSLRM